MSDGWFTLQSARRAARRLEPLARGVCLAYRRLRATAPIPVPEGPVDRAYFKAVRRFHAAATALSGEGVLFRDLDRGWLEFRSRRAGREVRLAWHIGLPDPDETGLRGGPVDAS